MKRMTEHQRSGRVVKRGAMVLWLGLVWMLIMPGTVPAQDSGARPRAFVPEAWPRDVGAAVNSSPVLGDLDQDGVLEIVVGADNHKVYVWKPDGSLAPGWPVTTGDSVRSSPALADLTNTGHLDVIVGSFDNKVYAWNYHGSLLPGWPVVTGSVVYSSPAVGDITGNQRPEVVVGSFDNKVYAWNPDGTLVRGWPRPTGLFVYSSPALADLDRDGILDVIVGTDNNRVFAWKGDGTDLEGWPTATEHVVPSSPAVGDIDQNGLLDIVVGSWDKVFVWNSRGERRPGWPVTAGHQIPSSPALADLTGNGQLEIIVGCKDGRLYVWDINGQLLPGWPAVTNDEITASPVVADVNGSGTLDVIVGSKDGNVYAWDAEGRLLPGWPKTTGGEIASSPAIADVDGDGTLEVFVGAKDGRVYAWSLPRTGPFQPRVVWGNFRGDPSRSGLYHLLPHYASPAPPSQIASAPTQTLEAPGTPAPAVIIPAEIREGAITNLAIADYTDTQVTLRWSAPTGMRTSQTAYEIRYSIAPITEETWHQAIPDPAVIVPASAGMPEVHTLSGLPRADALYFAIRLRDGQTLSPLSNVAQLTRIDTVAPGKITTLTVTELSDEVLQLSWTTTGDDGDAGLAAAYDLRYSDAPLDELTWLRAIQIEDKPAPLPAGTPQTFQLRKPWRDREIFFGIKVIDAALNISELSNVAVWTPHDSAPPARIADLRIAEIQGDRITLVWTAPGEDQMRGRALRYDIRYSEYPLTDANWTAAAPAPNPPTPDAAGTPQTYTLSGVAPGLAGYIGIRAIDGQGNLSALSNVVEPLQADFTPPAAITDLRIDDIGRDWVRLAWTATGDQGQTGRAASYSLRYGGNLRVVQAWTSASEAPDPPRPAVAGTPETAEITGLDENATYYVAVRALDAQGNMSDISNVVRVKTFGRSTPETITDLAIEAYSVNGLTLNWTAPRDRGENGETVAGYDIRFSRVELHESSWDEAATVPAPRAPAAPGVLETMTLKGLPQDGPLYLGIKSFDALGNPSAISNVITVPKFDVIPPDGVLDLFVEDAGPNSVTLSWTATGNDGRDGQAASYQIRVAPTLNDLKNWDTARDIPTGDLVPAPSGMPERFTIPGLESKTTVFVALKALDEFGNASEISNIVRARTRDDEPPAMITDLNVVELTEDAVVLQWTAPGEDGMVGQATAYDVRYASLPITERSWETAQLIPLVPKPAPAGATERLAVTGLAPDTLYYFAVVAIDSSENQSPLSNVVDVLTIDTIPPPPITSLRVADVNEDGVLLTWLSPGDDAYRDAPQRYEIRYGKGRDGVLDDDSWTSAALAPNAPLPSGKGMREEFVLRGLDRNSWYAIAVKAFDEYDNAADMSNVVQVYTSSARVTDLAILEFSGQTVTLTWTTPGGDMTAHSDRRYDLRYATRPITEETWADAAPAQLLTPVQVKEPTHREKVEITGVPPYEQIFFAVKVTRQAPERWASPLSNVAELNQIDIIPPGEPLNLQIVDLGDTADDSRMLDLSWIAPGDNEMEGTATGYDLRYGLVPPTTENWETMTAAVGLPAPAEAGTRQEAVIRLDAQDDTLYFALRAYDEALNIGGLSNVARWAPEDTIPPAAVRDLRVETVEGGNLTLSWTAPGDNEDRGVAAFYDIRYATREADLKRWELAQVVPGEPLPEPAGTRQEYTLTGLQQDTVYYVGLKTTDDAKNTSELSNIVVIRTGDIIPPAAVADLRVTQVGDDWVELAWTAPGDDGNSGRASLYSLRYADQREVVADWELAYEVADVAPPRNPGSEERVRVPNLRSNTTYYFGVRTFDKVGNESGPSNIAQSLTGDGAPPAPIQDLIAVSGTDTSVTLSWTAPKDIGPVERVASYDIRYAENRAQLEDWNRARPVRHALTPHEPGTLESMVIDNLSINSAYYVGIRSADQHGNVSDISNIVRASTTDTIPPQPLTDVQMVSATENAVTIRWTVVEDDAAHDTPEIYEVRYALAPIDDTTWAAAQLAVPSDGSQLRPTAQGEQMTYTLESLAENTTYYVAVRAIDGSGNVSPLSNVVPVLTRDLTPPHAVADLQAAFPTADSIMLTWTSPSDVPSRLLEGEYSGIDLTAKSYDIRYTTADGALTDENWEAADQVLVPPPPQAPGMREEFVVRNLQPGQTYYLALRSIDQSGNVSAISNTAVEVTLPFEVGLSAVSPGISRSPADYAWELAHGQDVGQLRRDAGDVSLALTSQARSLAPAPALTAIYPQSGQMMELRQSVLTLQVKTPQRFALYVQVRTASGDDYYLCYTTDFGLLGTTLAEDHADAQAGAEVSSRRLTEVERRPRKRVENTVFFPIDPALLTNTWQTITVNVAGDLFEGAGAEYAAATRLAIRGADLTVRGIRMQGPILTKIDDFQTLQAPLDRGWNLHFGSGMVDIGREGGLPGIADAGAGRSAIRSIGVVPTSEQENLFLTARADSHRGLVLTYPKDSLGQVSDKPYFLANVRATGDFKLILKVMTANQQEYYLAYLPEAQLPQTGLSGNYIYLPLPVVMDEHYAGQWLTIHANLADDLKRYQLEYAHTAWISFHGVDFSLDNIHFSTAVLETVLE
jgi:WD40 repeat protein